MRGKVMSKEEILAKLNSLFSKTNTLAATLNNHMELKGLLLGFQAQVYEIVSQLKEGEQE